MRGGYGGSRSFLCDIPLPLPERTIMLTKERTNMRGKNGNMDGGGWISVTIDGRMGVWKASLLLYILLALPLV